MVLTLTACSGASDMPSETDGQKPSQTTFETAENTSSDNCDTDVEDITSVAIDTTVSETDSFGATEPNSETVPTQETEPTITHTHTEIIDTAVEPTCTETGLTEGKHCSECGEVLIVQETVAAKGHSEVIDAAVAPTCIESGLTEGKHCSECEKILIEQEAIPAIGHQYDETNCCVHCGQMCATQGLEYIFVELSNSYHVVGIGAAIQSDIVIPDEYDGLPVTGIDSGAFKECDDLTSITIPNSIENIGTEVFYGCDNLTSIQVISGNTTYHTSGNCLIETESKTLIAGCKSSIIPADGSVICIGDSAFSGCSSLTSITIPAGVEHIERNAFSDCTGLHDITIPDSVKSIDFNILSGCNNLVNMTVPFVGDRISVSNEASIYPFGCLFGTQPYEGGNETEQFYYDSSTSSVENCVYYIPESLRSVTVIGGSIYEYAFYNCKHLTNITLPQDLESIGNQAFSSCGSLQFIILPENLTSIGSHAFSGCGELSEIKIPDGVTDIGEGAFRNCRSLTHIALPNGVTRIEGAVFSGCAGLTDIVLSDNLESLGDFAFSECVSLTDITIPMGVRELNVSVFSGCVELKNVNIPESVTGIGERAFYGCVALTSITVPDSVSSIGIGAFSNCSSLESITLPFVGRLHGVDEEDIYQHPFGYVFGAQSYSGGVATTQVYYGKSTYEATSTVYYIPSSLKSVTITGGNILYGAFSNCRNLTDITFGNGVEYISKEALSGCENLINLSIPFTGPERDATHFDYFGYIFGAESFYYNNSCVPASLRTVTITGSISDLGSFYGCLGLTSIVLGDDVTGISDGAFRNCRGLTNVVIGKGVTSIGSSVFQYCQKLTDITFQGTMAEWEAIEKSPQWDADTGTYTIHCTDGDIAKE